MSQQLTIEECEHLFWLAARDIVFFSTYDTNAADWTNHWHACINCNDTFYYACADATPMDAIEASMVRYMYDKWDWAGVIAWCAVKRDKQPLLSLQTDKYREAYSYLKSQMI